MKTLITILIILVASMARSQDTLFYARGDEIAVSFINRNDAVVCYDGKVLHLKAYSLNMKSNLFFLTDGEIQLMIKFTYMGNRKVVLLTDERTGEERCFGVNETTNRKRRKK